MNKTQPKLTIALLAAGQASRFGSPKQLAHYQGQTFIERSIALLDSIECEPLIITGAHHTVISKYLSRVSKGSYVVFNQNWQQGMSSSIKAAVNYCSEVRHCGEASAGINSAGINSAGIDSAGIMFITVDQVNITQGDIQSLIDLWHKDISSIVCAEYAGHRGVPAIFPKQYFPKLLELQNDKGARNLIKSSANVKVLSLPNAELDIDTVEQLNELNDLHS
jgi:molybdenum cofactor cytidylyltransferase